ncbi:GAP family protein [Lutimaribacter marinistellae]|uniref:GAP family protein n=1 Tax=Lutimaribacter marinistellae TaxID=1820329 RepID=A0ABV7TJ63_9RHOB
MAEAAFFHAGYSLGIRKILRRKSLPRTRRRLGSRCSKRCHLFSGGTSGAGGGLAVANPKNAALYVSGALMIASNIYVFGKQIVVISGFIALSSVGTALPMALSLARGMRAERPLRLLSEFMEEYGALMVALVLAVLGGIMLVNALWDLWLFDPAY